MKRGRLLAIGLGAYALALFVTAPATLVDAGLRRASGGALRLAEAQGTLWSGTGQIEILDTARRTGVAKRLAWRVVPGWLLRGRLVCDVELDQATKRFPVAVSLSRVELANANVNLPAAVLGIAEPKLAPLGLSGDVRIHVTSLSIGSSGTTGSVALQWLAAGSALTPVSPLGDYELRLDGEGAVLRATLRTLQGPLQLDGGGTWTVGTRPAFSITARVLAEQRQLLAPLLQLIAVERSDGSFGMQLQ